MVGQGNTGCGQAFMRYRATLTAVPIKDPANPPKPVQIQSNSMEDVRQWAKAVGGSVKVEESVWSLLEVINGPEIVLS